MNRIVIFSHFDRDGIIADYVVYYIKQLKEVSNQIIFVTTAELLKGEDGKVEKYATVIQRENVGYDFYSWKTALDYVNLSQVDELIICNDSVYAPLYSLEEIFKKIPDDYDFWGMTDSSQIAYHIQSYFIVFRTNVLLSKEFISFWDDLECLNAKSQIINQYEIGLSQRLIKSGFKCGAVLKDDRSTNLHYLLGLRNLKYILICSFRYLLTTFIDIRYLGLNPTQNYWKQMIMSGVPVIKIELLRDNPFRVDISDVRKVIEQYTNYDYSLIQNHLNRLKNKPSNGKVRGLYGQ